MLNCLTYSSTNGALCTQCNSGFILNTVANTCNACAIAVSYCVTCNVNNNNACTACQTGYLLQNNSCA